MTHNHTLILTLSGPLADAVAVEWTDRAGAAPGDWAPCLRRRDGSWQLASHTPGESGHLRAPGPFGAIAIRYRLAAAGPWSEISAGRKDVMLTAVPAAGETPPALGAGDWSRPRPYALADGTRGLGVALSGIAAAAAEVQWSRAGTPQETDWTTCTALGEGFWHFGPETDGLADAVALRYRLAWDGPFSPASEDRKSAGSDAPVPVLPVLIAAPTLAGTGLIGEPLEATPGSWSGAPGLSWQWLRAGIEIPGATARSYTPVAADDGKDVCCRITAVNPAGSAASETTSIAVHYAAPQIAEALGEVVFDQGSGIQEIAAAPGFSGEALVFSVSGADAVVDAETGVIGIPTETPLDGAGVTVVAQNSGGRAEQSLTVTVEAETANPPSEPEYILAPWHTDAKRAADYPPSDNLQVILTYSRSPVNPDVIYAGQDVGGFWVSLDNGRSWNTLRNRGLGTVNAISVACCPSDEKHVLAVMGARFPDNNCGIYRSLDGGLNWTRVLPWKSFGEPRSAMQRLAYAPSTTGRGRDRVRWYAAFDSSDSFRIGLVTGKPGLVMSDDGGQSWSQTRDLPASSYGEEIYGCRVDPTNAKRLYLWGQNGLMRIDDATSGGGRSRLSGTGGLPGGRVRDLYVSGDGRTLICAAQGKGVYKSTDRGTSWAPLLSWGKVTHAAVNEGFPGRIYAYVRSGNPRQQVRYTGDGGRTWKTAAEVKGFPGEGRSLTVGGNEPYILPDPRDAMRATGFSDAKWFQTDDGGKTWDTRANAYYCGTHHKGWAAPHGFHPTNPEIYALGMLDTGIMYTKNGGITLQRPALNGLGLSHLSANGIALHPDGRHIIACVGKFNKGSLVYSDNLGKTWEVVEKAEKWRQYLGYDAGDADYAYQWRQISRNRGRTWQTISLPDASAVIVGVSQSPVSGASAVYAANLSGPRDKIWKTTDRGRSWDLVSNAGYNITAPGDVRTTFRVHPTNPHVIFFKGPQARNGASQIRRLDTRTSQHTDFDVFNGGAVEADFYADNFAIDGYNPDVMYLRSRSTGTGNYLFMTRNGGKSWENISEGFPNVTGGNGLEVHPLTGVVYVGTANGMYVRKPPYPVPTPKNTYDLLRKAYPDWRGSHLGKPF